MTQEKNKVLVIGAHPDDEILGVGGTLLRHVQNRDELNILILCIGEGAKGEAADIDRRKKQAQQTTKSLGAKNLFLYNLPDNQFDTVPLLKIVRIIERHANELKPNIIYTHCPYDLNIDHRLTFQAVLTACRPKPGNSVKKFLTFETLSSTEWQIKDAINQFRPTVYSDISAFIEGKIKLSEIYGTEVEQYPHPRSQEGIKVLARYRGMEVGYGYAEGFQLIRQLND